MSPRPLPYVLLVATPPTLRRFDVHSLGSQALLPLPIASLFTGTMSQSRQCPLIALEMISSLLVTAWPDSDGLQSESDQANHMAGPYRMHPGGLNGISRYRCFLLLSRSDHVYISVSARKVILSCIQARYSKICNRRTLWLNWFSTTQ